MTQEIRDFAAHSCRIDVVNAERPVYRVTCSECGTVTEQAYEIDAQAILNRHVEVQGFERPSDSYPRGSYDLIAIAPDGAFVVDSSHHTVTEAWEASDWGSKWFFYPVAAVVLNDKIVAAPEGFDYLEGVSTSELAACADEITDTLAMFA